MAYGVYYSGSCCDIAIVIGMEWVFNMIEALIAVMALIAFVVVLTMLGTAEQQTECSALELYINNTGSDYAQKSWIDKECYAHKVKPARSDR